MAAPFPERWTDYPLQVVVSTETSAGVNVRKEPSTGTTVMGRLMPGDRIRLGHAEGVWSQVQFKETLTGWAYRSLFEVQPVAEVQPPYVKAKIPDELLEILADEQVRAACVAILRAIADSLEAGNP